MKKLYSVLTAAALMPLCLLAGQVSQASQADEYNPEVRNLQVREGEYRIARELVKASRLIANFASLPAGSQASYLTAPDFAKVGSYKTQIKVTYPDKSTWTSSEFMIEVAPGAESTQSN